MLRSFLILLAPLICWGASAAPPSGGFANSVQPFLKKNCFLCHNAQAKTGGLNLQEFTTTAVVDQHRDTWEAVLRKLKNGEMPPKGLPRPNAAELETVTNWIQAEFDRQDQLAQPNPGRVTARRLNRAEYNNTIRDLLGVDFHPADNFPQDDSGYGFDDIGDVLSLSPLLMEKYMTAAEKIARVAVFGPEAMKPSLERIQPSGRKIPKVTSVPPDYDLTGLSLPNSVQAMHRFPVDGEYNFRINLGGSRPAGSEAIHVALWIDGKQVKEFEVAPDESSAKAFDVGVQGLIGETREFRTKVRAGDHWIAASILNLYDGLPPRFHGPNPSTRPVPPPPDFSKMFQIPPNASPQKIARIKKALAAAQADLERPKLNAADIDFLEIMGPYDEVRGPSEASLEKIYTCGHLHGHHGPQCARKIVANLAARAFRRPVTPREIQPYLRLASMGRKDGGSFDEGIAVALQAILVSPDFLFRIERDTPKESAELMHPVNQYELASRLSYFLWSSMPDEELTQCAKEGTLRKPDVLAAQVQRMLEDPKSDALVENFGGQWLEFRRLESVEPDHGHFPQFDAYLRMSMKKETELFLENIVRRDRSILDLIDGKYTFVNERLADFYGIPGVKGPEFRRVDLTGNTERGGVLTQASILTVSSYATRTSPVLRGKWILENILNDPPPPPPPGVPNLNVKEVGTSVSLREQMEAHRKNPACAVCHQKMDPLGFGLSNYNAIGHWRTKEGKFSIDASGTLPDGRTFVGAEGLKKILLGDRNAFAECVTEKLLTYALGRGLERYDRPTVKAIVGELAANDYRFSSLVLGIVNSLPFQMRSTDKTIKGEEIEAKR